jgi:hypothetical protein
MVSAGKYSIKSQTFDPLGGKSESHSGAAGSASVSARGNDRNRHELDLLQLETMARLLPQQRLSFNSRVRFALTERFFGQPLSRKIKFVRFALGWAGGKIKARMVATKPPRNVAKNDSLLHFAALGTGSLGDYVNYSPILEALHRDFG